MTETTDQPTTPMSPPSEASIEVLRPLVTDRSDGDEWTVELPGGQRLANRSVMGGGELSLSTFVTGYDSVGQKITRVRVVEQGGQESGEPIVRGGVTWQLSIGLAVEAVGEDRGKYHFTSGPGATRTAWMVRSHEVRLAERAAMLVDVLAGVLADLGQIHLDDEMDVDEYEWHTPEYEANQ